MLTVMVRRSDVRERMIAAARRLFRQHGYVGTALSDVITESAAPRGSLYFHFPGGKEELATEVSLLHAADTVTHVNRVAGTTDTAAEFIAGFMRHFRDEIAASDYRESCAVAPIVLECTPASAPLSDVTRRGFGDLIATVTTRLEEKGLERDRARTLASLAVTTMEGGLIVSRTLRSPEPFDAAITVLSASAQVMADASA